MKWRTLIRVFYGVVPRSRASVLYAQSIRGTAYRREAGPASTFLRVNCKRLTLVARA